ncbi:caspase family protein [Deltaproteobacteria bacterium OttesenSCG-928-M10]|nr:caspase family protein [Deltaproteobacteria bacterium OttesenSCG-928-M10]
MIKIAILFGNGKYQNTNSLKNPMNDAQNFGDKLEYLGFKTFVYTDLKVEEMNRYIEGFKQHLDTANVVLFFYAGHGFQYEGENYLAAIDSRFSDELGAKYSSISLNYILEILEKSLVQTSIIILDACRNNPFSNNRAGFPYRGLAPVSAPKGTIIAFATSPGQTASDGNGDNGLYTGALLQHIESKGITIEEMFKRVRHTVSAQSNNKQISWEHTSLMGNFYFNLGYDDGIFISKYSERALADSKFVIDLSIPIHKIIDSLKAHDWYKQNPAIAHLKKIQDLSHVAFEDLFVLGRNIYQTACGSSFDAIELIKNLETFLEKHDEVTGFHILNGILYEIYFDSNGKLREYFNTEYFERPVSLCSLESYNKSAQFIQEQLTQVMQQKIIYIPGTREICLDIKIVNHDGIQYVENIYYDGQPCMYNQNDDSLHTVKVKSILRRRGSSESDIYKTIESLLGAPNGKVKIIFSESIDKNHGAILPNDFRLLRYA